MLTTKRADDEHIPRVMDHPLHDTIAFPRDDHDDRPVSRSLQIDTAQWRMRDDSAAVTGPVFGVNCGLGCYGTDTCLATGTKGGQP